MNLKEFGEELKKKRIEKKLSLTDISVETRINTKFLEAIENGQFNILPQTYIRAFLREYALIINLDPKEIIEQYEAITKESTLPSSTNLKNLDTTTAIKKNSSIGLSNLSSTQRNLIFGAFIVITIIIVIILSYNKQDLKTSKTIEEISFDNVVRENEPISIKPSPIIGDSIQTTQAVKIDSLSLEMTTIDSVWINIIIDNKKGETHLFGPKVKRLWKAKERFTITMGNAGGALFRLNDKNIGAFGKRGAVIRNVIITENLLKNQ